MFHQSLYCQPDGQSSFKNLILGTFLAVQWLRRCTSTSRACVPSLVRELTSPLAAWVWPKKKKHQKKQKQKNPQKTHLSIFFLRYLWYQLLYFVFPGKTPKWGFAFRNLTGALSQGEHLRSNEESKFVGGTNWAAVQVQKGICLLLGVSAPGMGPLDVS